MNKENKPCPFCGSEELCIEQKFDDLFVLCTKCLTNGPFAFTIEAAWERWNKRNGEDIKDSKININIVRKGFKTIPDEVKHCPICGKEQDKYFLEILRDTNPMKDCSIRKNWDFVQCYPTFTCDNCQTIWQYLGEKENKDE